MLHVEWYTVHVITKACMDIVEKAPISSRDQSYSSKMVSYSLNTSKTIFFKYYNISASITICGPFIIIQRRYFLKRQTYYNNNKNIEPPHHLWSFKESRGSGQSFLPRACRKGVEIGLCPSIRSFVRSFVRPSVRPSLPISTSCSYQKLGWELKGKKRVIEIYSLSRGFIFRQILIISKYCFQTYFSIYYRKKTWSRLPILLVGVN